MDIFKIVALVIFATILIMVIKQNRPEIALILGVMAGILVLLSITDQLYEVVETIRGIGEKAGMNSSMLLLLLRITGIAYMTEFAAQLCRDASEGALATKVELAGKVLILGISVPILGNLMDYITQIMP